MRMPVGVIANAICLFLGGVLGTRLGKRLPEQIKTSLTLGFSLASFAMGIVNVVKMDSLPAVILSLLVGIIVGTLCRLEHLLRRAGEWTAGIMAKSVAADPTERSRNLELFTIGVILFCTGPTVVYGPMLASASGDNSLLFSKCSLDFFTAAIFAASAGSVITMLAAPVLVVETAFFLMAGVIVPYVTPEMFADFSGCGGILMIATAFRMAEIKMYRVTDMLPALAIVMPISYLWGLLPLSS